MRIAILTTDNREHFRDYANPQPYFGTAPEALLQGFALLPEAEVHVVSCTRARMKSPAKLAPNIFFHSIYMPKIGWMSTVYQGCVRATRKLLREINPDIVHGQGTERDCAINAVSSGYRNVLTIHGNMRLIAQVNKARPFSYWWLAAHLERFTIPRSDGVVCITRYTQDAVASLSKKTWVVPNAVDASFFEVNSAPDNSKPPVILCVGHVCLRKNQNAFIKALDPLAKELSLKLVFLGHATAGRPYEDEFLSLLKDRPWCAHEGWADRAKLKEHLHGATLVALPSLEDNCPMVVLEAQAAGVPVVAAKVGGLPDLIEESQTGFFCDPLDPASMRDAVSRALKDTRFARELATRTRARARERFHPRAIAQRHVEIYAEVLSRSQKPRLAGLAVF